MNKAQKDNASVSEEEFKAYAFWLPEQYLDSMVFGKGWFQQADVIVLPEIGSLFASYSFYNQSAVELRCSEALNFRSPVSGLNLLSTMALMVTLSAETTEIL